MFQDLAMRVFLVHLVAFIVVTATLAALNLWLTPQYPWWAWVLIGWGAGLATHAFALLLRKTRRRERIFIDKKARSFAVHLFAYLATVLILFFVNLTVTPKVWWFFWVAFGWGMGIIAHGWCAFFKRRPVALPQAPAPSPQATASEPQPATPARQATKEKPSKVPSKKAPRHKGPKRSS
jgi:hypothetical protein